jgi:hypothetical protein
MRLQPIAAALAAALLLAIPAAFGGADDGLGVTFPSSCTPETRKCEEKLAALGYPNYRAHHWPGSEQALLGLLESDPHCAMMLWGTALP